MFEIAGALISGITLLRNLKMDHEESTSWKEVDLVVDRDYLRLVIDKGILPGKLDDYAWSNPDKVTTREMEGTLSSVIAYNDDKRTKHRIIHGGQVLMKL